MNRLRIAGAAPLAAIGALAALLLAGAPSARAQDLDVSNLTRPLLDAGYESVAARAVADTVVVWYENRVVRYEMRALGEAARLCAESLDSATVLEIVPETRGVPILSVAARAGDWLRFLRGEKPAPWFRERLVVRSGAGLAPTLAAGGGRVERSPSRWKLDLAARPLIDLQLGLAEDPFLFGLWIAPEATMSPFRGGLLTAQAKIRIEDELDVSSPTVSLGRTTLSGVTRLPRGWVGAASTGYFSDDRYGVAAEVGRLVRGGALEVRAGGDFSGLLQFTRDVTLYSGLESWSAFGAVTHRTEAIFHGLNLATTLTGGRFEHGDAGARLDLVRRFGETEVGFFGIKTDEGSLGGFRLNVPLPLARVGRPARLRWTTVPHFPWEYRETVEPAALRVRPFDNLDRFQKGLHPTVVRNDLDALRESGRRGRGISPAPPRETGGVSLVGTTGLLNTPTAAVTPDGVFRFGVNSIDRRWSFVRRGEHDNTIYFFTLGFLPATEVSIRATEFPERAQVGEGDVSVVDRVVSGRLRLVAERVGEDAAETRDSPGLPTWRGPAIAIGIDDAKGNRRTHSLYLVGTKTLDPMRFPVEVGLTAGFGSRAIEADGYVLDGPFGGIELRVRRALTFVIENDTEKWNTGARIVVLSRLAAQGVFLDLDVFSGGVSWTQRF